MTQDGNPDPFVNQTSDQYILLMSYQCLALKDEVRFGLALVYVLYTCTRQPQKCQQLTLIKVDGHALALSATLSLLPPCPVNKV